MKEYNNIISFIRKLYKEPKEFIPLHAPTFIGNEKKYLNECIDSTFVSSVGIFVDRFEEMIADYTSVKKAIVTVNGTNAIHLALLSVGVDANTEVITQPLTFIATVNAIAYTGAKPVFVDVDLDTMGMSPKALRKWLETNVEMRLNYPFNINTNKRISAILPMHTFGHPCRIDEIAKICNEYNIPLVEDAAESLGSFYKGKHTGTFGKLGVISFNGNKTITTGGGGILLTNDEKLGNHLKHITTQAKIAHSWEYDHDYVGYNYRMPNINAAIGVAQMEKIEDILSSKRQIAKEYKRFFSDSKIKYITEPKESISNYWLNTILFESKKERDNFLKFSNDNGVMTRPVWKLMNKLEIFKDCQFGDLSNSEYLEDRIVNIPSSVILFNNYDN